MRVELPKVIISLDENGLPIRILVPSIIKRKQLRKLLSFQEGYSL